LITTRKPLEEAARVEKILARLAAFIRHFPVRGYDRVADGALSLPFESADDVFAEYIQAIGYRAVLDVLDTS
jgi:hypothetical protein